MVVMLHRGQRCVHVSLWLFCAQLQENFNRCSDVSHRSDGVILEITFQLQISAQPGHVIVALL